MAYNAAGPANSTNYNAMPYGGHAVSGAASSMGDGGSTSGQGRYPSQGWQPPQQRGRGGRGRGFFSSSSPGYSNTAVQGNQGRGSSAATWRGGVNMRGRGRGQRGRGRGSYSGHSDNYSEYTDFGAESQYSYSDNAGSIGQGARVYGGATGHGRGAFTSGFNRGARVGRGHQPNQPWASSTGPSHMAAGVSQPPVPPLMLGANPPHLPFRQPLGQSPSSPFGAPPITPPMPPLPPPPPHSAPAISSPLHLVPHSPLPRFPSYSPSQSSPTSPWAPPTQPLPPQQHYGHGHDGELPGSHLHYHQQQPSYQQRQLMQYGHQQQQQYIGGGGGSGENRSIAGPSTGQTKSSGTPEQPSDVIKALVSGQLIS